MFLKNAAATSAAENIAPFFTQMNEVIFLHRKNWTEHNFLCKAHIVSQKAIKRTDSTDSGDVWTLILSCIITQI